MNFKNLAKIRKAAYVIYMSLAGLVIIAATFAHGTGMIVLPEPVKWMFYTIFLLAGVRVYVELSRMHTQTHSIQS